MKSTPGDATDAVERLRTGGRRALATIFDGYRDRLRRMVELRIDPRLRARIDASDVLQEAFIDVARDLDAYLADPKLPPLLWLRLHVGRRLTTLYRQHLGTQMRDAGMEISLYRDALPEASSHALASMLLGKHTSPTQAAQRAELLLRVQEALNSLEPIEREILAMRHFEQLSRARPPMSSGSARKPAPSATFVLSNGSKASFPPCPAEARGPRSWRFPNRADRATTDSSMSWPRSSPSIPTR